ncbi:hypothetical protein [Clostridium beijerinckii]|nr:hypothetical protein [Clostridium beijerinckii]NRU19493.1 alanyl-tRNA synthetase [Clostridium beijerinckii]
MLQKLWIFKKQKNSGAIGIFDDKYADKVRVVSAGNTLKNYVVEHI